MDQMEKTSSFGHAGTGRWKKQTNSDQVDTTLTLYCNSLNILALNIAYNVCNGPNDGSFMIACHFCDEWFHRNCVGVTEKHARTENRPVCLS